MRQYITWFASALLFVASCKDDVAESPVPAGYVHYSCNITTVNAVMQQTDGQAQLDVPGGYVRIWDAKTITASDGVGTGGLLLLHAYEGNFFYAFDLTCPYCYRMGGTKAEKMQRLAVDADGMTARCGHCNSAFGAVFWGSPAPTEGPANQENYHLRQYHATLLGDVLTVTK